MAEPAEQLIPISLEDELAESYGRYARYTILHRAIPDVRDGLKPVQRRIIYAMYESRNLFDRPYRKCAKTVGDVMGNYHPHGDQSIYDALVRMAQPWKMSQPLVDGHGNFGSMDDDPPAAMRYTESRLAAVAQTLLEDIEKDTVSFVPNFDQSESEPSVLPARLPNLLVNGCTGLSTGFATEIPPHNLGEIIDAVLSLSRKPDLTTEQLCQSVRGPDFPTGGLVVNADDLPALYEKGKGRVVLRARTRVEAAKKKQPAIIVIEEIPFGVVKSDLVGQLDNLRLSGGVRGIADVRDESDREGLRVVIELEKNADAQGVLNFLFKKTNLQVNVSVQMMVISRGAPRRLGLRQLLAEFLLHRREVITRRSRFELGRTEKRLHEVDGLIRAVDLLDQVLTLVRGSRDRAQAKEKLIQEMEFTAEQAEAILELRLHRLTSLQMHRLEKEQEELRAFIQELTTLLGDPNVLEKVLRRELREIKRNFAQERRTQIEQKESLPDVALTVTVPKQKVLISLTQEGYIKRCSPRSEQDPERAGARPGDYLRWVLEGVTTDRLLVFPDEGTCNSLPVHTLPEGKWSETGTALVNLTPIRSGQRIAGLFSIGEFDSERSITMVTAQGKVKRTLLPDFDTNRTTGIAAIKLAKKDDSLVRSLMTREEGDLLLITEQGMAIRFSLMEVPIQGRNASGVRGIRLDDGDRVVDALHIPPDVDGSIVLLTRTGRIKKSALGEYAAQGRGGRGTRTLRQPARGSHNVVTAALELDPKEPWWVVSSLGKILFFRPGDVPSVPRDSKSRKFMDLEGAEELSHWAVDSRGGPEPEEQKADSALELVKKTSTGETDSPERTQATTAGSSVASSSRNGTSGAGKEFKKGQPQLGLYGEEE